MAQIKKYQWAWLAGFMDGDGYFTCAVWERNTNGVPTITIAPRIGAAQIETRRDVLDYIVEITGVGKVYLKKEKSNKLNSAEQAMWITSKANDIIHVCKNILPYIYNKKFACETLLKLVELRSKTVIRGGKGINKKSPIESTMECARLGLSLNPHATVGHNSRHNSVKRTWQYWEKRIPEVYKEADNIIFNRSNKLRVQLKCDVCSQKFERLKCNIREGTKHNYCSEECREIGDKTLRYKEKIIVNCTYCNIEFEKSKATLRKNNFCNNKCKKQFHKLKGAENGKKDNDRHPDQQMAIGAVCNLTTTGYPLANQPSVDSGSQLR